MPIPKEIVFLLCLVGVVIVGLVGDFITHYGFRSRRRPITRGAIDGEEVNEDHDYKVD